MVLAASGHGVSPDVVRARRNPCAPTVGLADEDNIGYNAPRVLADHARQLLQRSLNATALFDLGDQLSWVVKRVSQGEYILGVQNPEMREAKLDIQSRIGAIKSMEEIETDQSVNQSTVGWVPAGYAHLPLGRNSMTTIAGLEIRVFRVLVSERAEATEPIAPLNRSNYDDQPMRLLRLGHGIGNLQHELIARPSFKTRFRGVVVDSAFVHSRTVQELEIVGSWVAQNNLTLAVDLSRVIQVFPYPPRSFRMYRYMPAEYNKSMEMFMDVIDKLPVIGSTDLIITLHINPPTSPNVASDIQDTVGIICAAAKRHGATVHLRQAPKNDDFISGGSSDAGQTMAQYVKKIDADNLRVAPQVGLLLKHNRSTDELAALFSSQAPQAKLLLVGGYNVGVVPNCRGSCDFSQAAVSSMDAAGQAQARALAAAAAAAGATLVHDAAFADWQQALDDVAATAL